MPVREAATCNAIPRCRCAGIRADGWIRRAEEALSDPSVDGKIGERMGRTSIQARLKIGIEFRAAGKVKTSTTGTILSHRCIGPVSFNLRFERNGCGKRARPPALERARCQV
jgi:hypothetical protein